MKVIYVIAAALVLAASFATVVAAETAVAPGAVQGGIMDSRGQRMPDGSVYAGASPDTPAPTYTTQADAPGLYSWKKGIEYCAALDAGGHRDWRVPTRGELNMLFQNRDAIGGFSISGLHPAGWYWSSSQYSDYGAWDQRFSDGHQDGNDKGNAASLRCVR
jgi:hypothetical protein